MGMFKKLLPTAYKKINKYDKNKKLACISLACFCSWFLLLITLFNVGKEIGVITLISAIVFIFLYFVIGLIIKNFGIEKEIIDDLANYPPIVHYLIITFTIILLLIMIIKIIQYYDRSKSIEQSTN